MTTQYIRRCIHCHNKYCYQASGPDAPDLNDGSYCHDCKAIIVKALKTKTTLYEKRSRPVDKCGIVHYNGRAVDFSKVTMDMVLEWERDHIEKFEEQKKRGNLTYRRIFPALFDLKTGYAGHAREVFGRDAYAGIPFYVVTWPEKSGRQHENEIKVDMAWDLSANTWTGELW